MEQRANIGFRSKIRKIATKTFLLLETVYGDMYNMITYTSLESRVLLHDNAHPLTNGTAVRQSLAKIQVCAIHTPHSPGFFYVIIFCF